MGSDHFSSGRLLPRPGKYPQNSNPPKCHPQPIVLAILTKMGSDPISPNTRMETLPAPPQNPIRLAKPTPPEGYLMLISPPLYPVPGTPPYDPLSRLSWVPRIACNPCLPRGGGEKAAVARGLVPRERRARGKPSRYILSTTALATLARDPPREGQALALHFINDSPRYPGT